MAERLRISSSSPYEPVIGFSRAVRVGDTIYVSGSVAYDSDGQLMGQGDVYAQAVQTIRNIAAALRQAGATLDDVVRTRVYLTDISRWEEAARAHREAFAEVRPASSFLGISALASPDMLVEIEAVAMIGDRP